MFEVKRDYKFIFNRPKSVLEHMDKYGDRCIDYGSHMEGFFFFRNTPPVSINNPNHILAKATLVKWKFLLC
jgi:hypothetical protein